MAKISNIKETRIKQRAGIQLFCKNNPKIKIRDVANTLGVSPMSVSRWKNKNYFQDIKRKRRTKMIREIKNFLLKKSRNKFTGVDKASTRILKLELQKKFNLYISHVTINNWLRKLLHKPIKAKKTFLLREKDKNRRRKFYKR